MNSRGRAAACDIWCGSLVPNFNFNHIVADFLILANIESLSSQSIYIVMTLVIYTPNMRQLIVKEKKYIYIKHIYFLSVSKLYISHSCCQTSHIVGQLIDRLDMCPHNPVGKFMGTLKYLISLLLFNLQYFTSAGVSWSGTSIWSGLLLEVFWT